MHRNTALSLIVCASLAALTGCSGREKYTDEDYDDVATAVGALVGNGSAGETTSMEDSIEIATGAIESNLSNMGSGAWQGQRAGLTYDYEVICKDADGASQTECDETTDSANLVLSWSGNLDLPHYDASIDRTGDWTLSGLQTDTAVFNGHGSFDVATEFTGWFRPITRTFELDYDAQYDGVTFDRLSRRFTGGMIHYDVSAQRTVTGTNNEREATIDVNVDVELLGDGSAHISVDGVRNYDLDLSTGQVSPES